MLYEAGHKPPSPALAQSGLFEKLRELPGIGPNTAGSILAFAFNIPYPFIETNIRSVFIHFFFANSRKKVTDAEILPLIEKTMDNANPREWYYALMDYGSHLKRLTTNPSRKSAHYARQSPFRGSNRELRSKILKLVMKHPADRQILKRSLGGSYRMAQIRQNLTDLQKEGFITLRGTQYQITI